MAKFILKSTLVAPLTAAGVIDGSGNMKMRITHKTNRISGETVWEVVFNPTTHAIQTSNEHAQRVLRGKKAPKIKQNGSWYICDPTIAWFDEVDDGDAMPGVIPDSEGTEMHPKRKRNMIYKYARKTGTSLPASKAKVDLDPYLADATDFFAGS